MRPSQQKNRMRGRGRKQPNPMSRNFESNGPDVKIRGNAAHIAEKYMSLARDATSSGDRVMAENYLQHAEHYNRIVAAAMANSSRNDDNSFAGRGPQPDFSDDDSDDDDENAGVHDNQPRRDERQARQQHQMHNRPHAEARDHVNGAPTADTVAPQEASQGNGTESAPEGGQPERPARDGRGRRRPRRSDASASNPRADDSGEESASAENADRESRADISSDAAKLPGNLIGVGNGHDASSGASGED